MSACCVAVRAWVGHTARGSSPGQGVAPDHRVAAQVARRGTCAGKRFGLVKGVLSRRPRSRFTRAGLRSRALRLKRESANTADAFALLPYKTAQTSSERSCPVGCGARDGQGRGSPCSTLTAAERARPGEQLGFNLPRGRSECLALPRGAAAQGPAPVQQCAPRAHSGARGQATCTARPAEGAAPGCERTGGGPRRAAGDGPTGRSGQAGSACVARAQDREGWRAPAPCTCFARVSSAVPARPRAGSGRCQGRPIVAGPPRAAQ